MRSRPWGDTPFAVWFNHAATDARKKSRSIKARTFVKPDSYFAKKDALSRRRHSEQHVLAEP